MRRCHRCCITTPVRVISSGAISGTCVRPAGDWAIRPPSRARGPRPTPWKWGLPEMACAVYRASQRPYRALFESVWGQQSFAIQWPDNVEQVCDQPGPPPANDPTPVHLSQVDRGRAAATFDQMAQSIAGYEASAEVTTFTSKFDARSE